MSRFLLVCLAGAVGTGARYLLGNWAQRALGPAFPYGTLAVNLIGSFLISAIVYLGLDQGIIKTDLRIVLTAGLMGGFTTYSSFNFETMRFLQEGAFGFALLNVASTLIGCPTSEASRPYLSHAA